MLGVLLFCFMIKCSNNFLFCKIYRRENNISMGGFQSPHLTRTWRLKLASTRKGKRFAAFAFFYLYGRFQSPRLTRTWRLKLASTRKANALQRLPFFIHIGDFQSPRLARTWRLKLASTRRLLFPPFSHKIDQLLQRISCSTILESM